MLKNFSGWKQPTFSKVFIWIWDWGIPYDVMAQKKQVQGTDEEKTDYKKTYVL